MDREGKLKIELSIRAQYRRKLDAVLLAIDRINEGTAIALQKQIEVVSDKIQDELKDND